MTNICMSGGADGSDLEWGRMARSLGHSVQHWTFWDRKTDAAMMQSWVLREHELALADPHCKRANLTLKRTFPPRSPYVHNLLRRNWYQVKTSDSCYAVSTFGLPTGTRLEVGQTIDAGVHGGTAWAVEMFKNRRDDEPCACYVFDQENCDWFKWEGVWTKIYEPPRPQGVWTGIGTRDLHMIGRLAMHVLMDFGQDFHHEKYPMLR